MSIIFITGTSGAGKTTLINHLKNKLSKDRFEIYDFDEVGVPTNAGKEWRLKTTNYWLMRAKEHHKEKKTTIVCGVSVPSEVLHSTKKPDLPIYFGFLKIDDETIRQRLKARGWDNVLIQDNINWAHYLENEVKNQKHHLIVDGTHTPEQIANSFIKWIKRISSSNNEN